MDKYDSRILRLDCLRLAITQDKFNDDGTKINLNADEVVVAADKFYEFLTKDKKD